jgi:hypothetical protein
MNHESLQELEEDILMVYIIMMIVACNIHNTLNANDLEEGSQTIVNHNVGVTDILSRTSKLLALFKVLTNFEVHEL